MPTVHGVPLSPFVRKVRIGLAEKGIAHQVNPVVPLPPANSDPAFRKMSPLGKIPAYEDGDFAISDSSIILAYLERTQPTPPLVPENPRDQARAQWLEEFADSKLAEGVGTVFFQRIVAPNIMKQPTDQAAIDAALGETLPPLFDYLNEQIGDNEFFVGGRFTIADIAIGSMLRQFQMAGESVDAARWPKLAAYAERILGRPSFKNHAAEEAEVMKSLA